MEKNYEQLNQRLIALERKFTSLEQTNTIPDQIEKALRGRGFLNEKDIFWGFTTASTVPNYIELPFGSLESIALVTPIFSSTTNNILAEVVTSPTNPNGLALLIYSGAGTHLCSFIVFNFKGQPLIDNA